MYAIDQFQSLASNQLVGMGFEVQQHAHLLACLQRGF
jgi:hypothetical protein